MEPRLLLYKICGTELILSLELSNNQYTNVRSRSEPSSSVGWQQLSRPACLVQHMLICVPGIFFSIYNLASHIHVRFVSKYMILLSMKALHPISHTSIIAAQLNVFHTFDGHISNSLFRLFPAGALAVTPGPGSQYCSPGGWRVLTLEPSDFPAFWC